MPFYEYQCKSCGHELEAMQKISEEPLKKCPHCGKSQLQRLISAPVFRLKGGGWYETDFKDDKDKKRNLADRPDADSGKETESKKTDATESKPEPKVAEKDTAVKPTTESSASGSKTSTAKAAKKRPVKAVPKKVAAKPKAKSKSQR